MSLALPLPIPAVRRHKPSLATTLGSLLLSDGDERLALDPAGFNKYLCPPRPEGKATRPLYFSSCTATPISHAGWICAGLLSRRLTAGTSTIEDERLDTAADAIASALDRLLGLSGLADIILTPSGTDAALIVTGLLAAERPCRPIVSIMAAPGETGSGVPLAASGRAFTRGPRIRTGDAVAGFAPGGATVHIPLREPYGRQRSAAEIDDDFHAAAAAARGRPVIHQIDCSKTGISAPGHMPEGVDVVVDACQGRTPAKRIAAALARGWPVLITGSKFIGGPAFSGAILFPKDRSVSLDPRRIPAGLLRMRQRPAARHPWVGAGAILRWEAALAEWHRWSRLGPDRQRRLAEAETLARLLLGTCPSLAVMPPPDGAATGIVTFGVNAPGGQLLKPDELARLYRRLRAEGLLLGQPVVPAPEIAALRLAIGARNLTTGDLADELGHAVDSLNRVLGSRR